MNEKALRKFLIDSNKAGYAGSDDKKWVKESDGSTTINFKKGNFKSHDNFFGGEPYGGRTIVFFNSSKKFEQVKRVKNFRRDTNPANEQNELCGDKNKPIWIMVYYGWIAEGIKPDDVYGILKSALKRMPKNFPFRGPEIYKDEKFIYRNRWRGELERFSGEEKITKEGKLLYKANYMGGLVDQRREA
jgi:hypothetical protein